MRRKDVIRIFLIFEKISVSHRVVGCYTEDVREKRFFDFDPPPAVHNISLTSFPIMGKIGVSPCSASTYIYLYILFFYILLYYYLLQHSEMWEWRLRAWRGIGNRSFSSPSFLYFVENKKDNPTLYLQYDDSLKLSFKVNKIDFRLFDIFPSLLLKIER